MNIILTGFMGSGKSCVGRALAARLNMRFIDTDQLIAGHAGKSIEAIFAEEGEDAFRYLESQTICNLSGDGMVVAIGGGALLRKHNLDFLKSFGLLIHLRAAPQTVLQRVKDGCGRPVMAGILGDPAGLEALMATREEGYSRADAAVETDGLSINEVAERIIRLLSSGCSHPHGEVSVELGDRSYRIVISRKIDDWQGLIGGTGFNGRLAVITDDRVAPLYLERSLAVLAGFDPLPIIMPSGERTKTVDSAGQIYELLIGHNFDRSCGILALGGGVIGDLAGFVAATYMRGIPFFQAPTTLLAQVDSSIGGKVAVNHPLAKNIIGAFYQPGIVLIETDTLQSLPMREVRAGLAEVVKYGIIYDTGFFDFLEQYRESILALNPEAVTEVILRSCRIKAAVVAADEKENGLRAILNYGHTIGHALEYIDGYSGMRHGEAVAVGMAAAARLAVLEGFFTSAGEQRQNQLLAAFGLPLQHDAADRESLLAALKRDKKSLNCQPRFILPESIGHVRITGQVDDGNLSKALNSVLYAS